MTRITEKIRVAGWAARRKCAGTAAIELVLIMPFLALLLGLILFFGWASMNQQMVFVADRYSAWHRVQTGAYPTEDMIREMAFDDRPGRILQDTHSPRPQTSDELVAEAIGKSQRAGLFADELLMQHYPGGHGATIYSRLDSSVSFFAKYPGDISHRADREGETWRRADVSCWDVLRNQFYQPLDDGLTAVPAPADKMAGVIRGLYLTRW